MRLAENIQTHYARIGQQASDEDRIKAYMEFVHVVQERRPTTEEIAETSLQGSRALNAIDAGFAQETYDAENQNAASSIKDRSDRMFARTGTLVVASMSHILAVRGYTEAEDDSDDYLGLINVARAALCYPATAQIGGAEIEYANAIDTYIRDLELTQQIAFAAAPGHNGAIYAAGAVGIKPSEFTLSHLDEPLNGLVAADQANHLSGFFGRMAAVSTLGYLTNERLDQHLSTQRLSENLHSLISADINVH